VKVFAILGIPVAFSAFTIGRNIGEYAPSILLIASTIVSIALLLFAIVAIVQFRRIASDPD
jgi:hypothetical protein